MLIKSLLQQLPDSRYYLKLDADAMLRTNLRRFLGFLHRNSAVGSRIYFGTAFGTYNCTLTVQMMHAGRTPSTVVSAGYVVPAEPPTSIARHGLLAQPECVHACDRKRSSDSNDWRKEADAYSRLDRQMFFRHVWNRRSVWLLSSCSRAARRQPVYG